MNNNRQDIKIDQILVHGQYVAITFKICQKQSRQKRDIEGLAVLRQLFRFEASTSLMREDIIPFIAIYQVDIEPIVSLTFVK